MKINKTYEGDNVPKTTKWVYSATAFGRDAAYALVSAFLVTYITFSGVLTVNDYGLYVAQLGVISLVLVIARIWDALNDPIMGWIVERCHFKMGKYKPWILIGAIGNTAVMLTLFLWRPSGWGFVAMFTVFYFLWDFVFTMNDIGYWSMLPSLTSDEKQRNNITTLMSIFISLGTFAVYGLVPVLTSAGNYANAYMWIAIVVSAVFLLSQLILVFFCKERKRDPKQEAISEKAKISDVFKLAIKNSQLRWSTIAIFIYYLGSTIVIGFGLNYFYLTYGYGSANGGAIQTLFTVMYAVATILVQVLFPLMIKKLTRKQLFLISFIVTVVGYALMYVVGMPLFGEHPLAYGNLTFLLYICAFLIFAGQGVFYLILLVMMQNSIEYGEWKTGERKEAAAFSLRPLTAKLSSAIQQGVIYATMLGTGLYAVTSAISTAENEYNIGVITEAEFNSAISDALAMVTPTSLNLLGIGMIILPIILMVGAYLVINGLYKIDEIQYKNICADLRARHELEKENEKQEEQ